MGLPNQSLTSVSVKFSRVFWGTATAMLLGFVFVAGAAAQTFFYTEVVKDARIYVFATQSRYDAFTKSNSTEVGNVIERAAYGPKGETVVFDSEDAINLYNFKHGLPGESFPKSQDTQKSAFPAGKFSGLMFGDYYYYYQRHQDGVSPTDPTPVEDEHGFWFRRIYFTYDYSFSEKLTTRFRLELNSNGKFAGGDIVPYVKDAYLKWTYTDSQQLTLGIQPSLTFDWFESTLWGLRHVEKTPADLYKLDSSRDLGISSSGPTPINGLKYAVQFGNESGAGSETQQGKILRFETRFERNPGIALEGFYSFGRRPGDRKHRQTAQGIFGFRNDVARAAVQYLWQQRRRQAGDDHQTITVWSGFGTLQVLKKKAGLFLRVDNVSGDLAGVETGLPGAEGIDYLLLSSQSPFTTWIFGGEWYFTPSVRVGPNFELVRYSRDPDPVNLPERDRDSIFRVTFYWTF